MKTRLDSSHELAYLQKHQGKQFKATHEKTIFKQTYTLGSYNQETQMVTVTWDRDSVEYKLGDVLKYILLKIWLIK